MPTPTKRLTKEPAPGLTITDSRLDVFRPDPALVDEYVSREMPNGQTDLDFLLRCWRRRENVMLVGDTQGGKTMVVNVLAVLAGMESIGMPLPVFTLSASSGITDFDLYGQPTAWTDPDTGVEQIVWLAGLGDMAARVGGIFYLDEVNMMPERVTSSLHPLCDWRRSFVNRAKAVKVPGDGFMPEIVKASEDLWIVGTMNPNYRGAGSLNEAFANRFLHLMWGYNDDVEKLLIPNEGARMLGEALRTLRDTGHISTPVGTKALMRLAEQVADPEVGVDMALYCLRSMFNLTELVDVDQTIEDRSFRSKLQGMPTTVPGGWSDPDNPSPFG